MRFEPLGDQAVLAYCDDERAALAWASAVRTAALPWCLDVVQAYTSVAVFYEDGVQRMVVPGADGRYGTADDRVLWRETFTFNPDGTVASETSDPPSHITYTYDGHGARVEAVNRWSAGPDGIWDTDDDDIAERWTYLTDR